MLLLTKEMLDRCLSIPDTDVPEELCLSVDKAQRNLALAIVKFYSIALTHDVNVNSIELKDNEAVVRIIFPNDMEFVKHLSMTVEGISSLE